MSSPSRDNNQLIIDSLLNRLTIVEETNKHLQSQIDKQNIIIHDILQLLNSSKDKETLTSTLDKDITQQQQQQPIPIITTIKEEIKNEALIDSANTTPIIISKQSTNIPPVSLEDDSVGVSTSPPSSSSSSLVTPPTPPTPPKTLWKKPFLAGLMGGSRLRREQSKEEVYVPPMSPKPTRTTSIGNASEDTTMNVAVDVTQSQILKFQVPTLPDGSVWAVVWEYDAADDDWTRGMIAINMESRPFASGALRNAYKLQTKINPVLYTQAFHSPIHDTYEAGKKINLRKLPRLFGPADSTYVAKLSKTDVPHDRYFDDVKMQMLCKEYGTRYNSNQPPKAIDFLSAWVIELQKPRGGDSILYGLEMFIEGEFKKQNSNFGSVFGDRNTPQAFSHFTYEASAHELLVVDIQGVDDHYTDPQIHTKDGKGYGAGNLGDKGIERFLKSHKCNPICIQFELPPIGVDLNDSRNMTRVIRGTMLVPDLKPDLDQTDLILADLPTNPSSSELVLGGTLVGHPDRVQSIVIDEPNNLIISGSADGTLKLWQLDTLQCFETIRAHRKSITSICFNSTHYFTSSSDQTIKIWDRKTNLSTATLDGHTGEINCICIDNDRNHLFSSSFDKSIRVWDLNDTSSYKCIKQLTAHSKSVKSITISGRYLFSASNDETIKVWDLDMLVCIYGIGEAHGSWITSLGLHNNLGLLFSGARDGMLKTWNLNTFMSSSEHDDHNDSISNILVTDRFIFTAAEDSSIKIYDLSQTPMKCVLSFKAHRGSIHSIATDGKRIFSGGADNQIKYWSWKDK